MAPLLTVRTVSKRFGSLEAVADISLSIAEGEIFGIAGPNGAGKSTLFDLITGIPYGPDAGEIWLGEHRIDGLPPHRIAHLGIARTFQKEVTFGSLSVANNVALAASYGRRRQGSSVSVVVERALDRFGLTGRADALAAELPLLQKKRLMLATAMAMSPRLLLLDEPASGLNQVEIRDLDQLINGMNREGITIILIEHVLPLLMSVSERVMVMDSGRLLSSGTPSEVVGDKRVIEAYLGARGRKLTDAAN